VVKDGAENWLWAKYGAHSMRWHSEFVNKKLWGANLVEANARRARLTSEGRGSNCLTIKTSFQAGRSSQDSAPAVLVPEKPKRDVVENCLIHNHQDHRWEVGTLFLITTNGRFT